MQSPNYHETLENGKYNILNRSNQLKFASDFFQTSNGKYTSIDPRLKDVLRGGYNMELNVPVYDASWRTATRDSMKNKIRAQKYSSYKDIDGGQISYYTDNYLSQPFFSPNYQIRTNVHPHVFIDPMGSIKPEYNRNPVLRTPDYISDYSFSRDQIGFREDIMSLQSRKRDQEDYAKFHNNIKYFS